MKTRKSVAKRRNVLQAAAKIFAMKGFSETTLVDIASEAGTYAGSLYYYFSSKESMVEEVLNIGTTSVSNLVIAQVSTLPESTRVYDKIRIALESHLQQMLLKDDFVVAYWKLIDQVPEEIRQRHLVWPRAYGKFWQKMISEAQTAGEIRADLDARLIRLLLIGSTIYALDWFRPNGTNTPKEIADVLAEMFFFGVLPRGKADRQNVLPRGKADRQDARTLLLARRTVGGVPTNGAAARARKVSDITRKLAKSR